MFNLYTDPTGGKNARAAKTSFDQCGNYTDVEMESQTLPAERCVLCCCCLTYRQSPRDCEEEEEGNGLSKALRFCVN